MPYYQANNQYVQKQINSTQSGFTLIELMLSLILGLLIAAAAFQVFYISQRTSTTQRSASDIQDSAVFGIQAVEHDIRLANLGADSYELNKSTGKGGIVFSATNTSAPLTDAKYSDYYTKQAASDSYYGTVADKKGSDQLTIQFTTPEDMVSCEGFDVAAKKQLVQRYYLRNVGTTAKPSFALACDAAIVGDPDAKKGSFGDDGEIVIPNVDQFRVLLMTEKGYKDINTYSNTYGSDLIYGVKLGFVLAGGTPTIQAQNADDLKLLGQSLTPRTGITPVNTVRRVYEPNILMRNARVK